MKRRTIFQRAIAGLLSIFGVAAAKPELPFEETFDVSQYNRYEAVRVHWWQENLSGWCVMAWRDPEMHKSDAEMITIFDHRSLAERATERLKERRGINDL